MPKICALALLALCLYACQPEGKPVAEKSSQPDLQGTWKLLSGTLVEKGDTTVTRYTGDTSFIKIINASHFAFLLHDLKQGKDSSASFSAGAGRYTLVNDQYTEHLEYCSARNWEGHDFTFTVTIRNDTLVQQGVEKIEKEGIDRLNIETYVRVSK